MLRATMVLITALSITALYGDESSSTPPPINQAALEEAQQRVLTMKVWKMTEALGLSNEQEVPFFNLFNQLEELRRQSQEAKKQLISKMAQTLDQASSSNDEYSALIGEYQALENDFNSQQQALLEKISNVLNLKQNVEFYVVDETFAEDVRRAIAAERWKTRQNEMMDNQSMEAARH